MRNTMTNTAIKCWAYTQELISAGHVPITWVKFQETTAVMQINEKNWNVLRNLLKKANVE